MNHTFGNNSLSHSDNVHCKYCVPNYTNEDYMKMVYAILDEWSVMNTANLEDVYEAMKELERRKKNDS